MTQWNIFQRTLFAHLISRVAIVWIFSTLLQLKEWNLELGGKSFVLSRNWAEKMSVCPAVWTNSEQGKQFRNIENGILNPNVPSFFSTCLRTAIRNTISGLMYLGPGTDLILLSSISVSRQPLELTWTGCFIITFTLRFRISKCCYLQSVFIWKKPRLFTQLITWQCYLQCDKHIKTKIYFATFLRKNYGYCRWKLLQMINRCPVPPE